MKKSLKANIWMLLFLLIGFSCGSYEVTSFSSSTETVTFTKSSSNRSIGLNIADVHLSYAVYLSGAYSCSFNLQAFGNNYTTIGSAQGVFYLLGVEINDFSLSIEDTPVIFEKVVENSSTRIAFSTVGHTILDGHPFTIKGEFWGDYSTYNTSEYMFNLGIDWGTKVGSQHTSIAIDYRKFTIVSINPKPHMINDVSYTVQELKWNDLFTSGFQVNLELYPRGSLNEYLIFDLPSIWNATIGYPLVGSIQSNCTFNLTLNIITPSWVSCNIDTVILNPNQNLSIKFTLSSQITLGTNGVLKIIVEEAWEPYYIQITITSRGISSYISIFLNLIFIISVFFVIGFVYYHQTPIQRYFQKKFNIKIPDKQFSANLVSEENESVMENDTTPSWDSIKNRWESILPANELKMIEVLFFQGSLNQKSLGEELGLSSMTISRIISRLESKRLVSRERLGMSNMIKLDRKRL